MQLSEEEKQEKVNAYCMIFPFHTKQQVQQICEHLNWDECNCVDRLCETQPQAVDMSDSQMAGNSANTAENMTSWFAQKLQITDQQPISNQNQSNTNNNNNITLQKKYATATAPIKMSPSSSNSSNGYCKHFNTISMKAKAGQKLMIIMRGVPGSGKSTLAESLLRQSCLLDKYKATDFIYSTDHYFNTSRGYEFDATKLNDAHIWNQQRVRQKAAEGWSPIIVDNTNVMIWEMQPYVQIAVSQGYVLELLEPQNSWCKSASKLAQKNIHQVPRESIQRMLERYEKTTVADLLKLLKETKYTVPLPQLRQQPPLLAVPAPLTPSVPPTMTGSNPTFKRELQVTPNSAFKLNVNAQSWKPFEISASDYWGQAETKPAVKPAGETSLLDLLRDEPTAAEEPRNAQDEKTTIEAFQRHSLNCPHEAENFKQLRQMYPNKVVTGLWDLYVKCAGELDWAVDILLKEDELNTVSNYETEIMEELGETFQCACNNASLDKSPFEAAVAEGADGSKSNCLAPKLLGQRPPRNRRSQSQGAAHKELQLQIENCFVLGDDQYSEHTRKIRDLRNGILEQPLPINVTDINTSTVNEEEELEVEEEEDNSLLEIELGEQMIDQLCNAFRWEGSLGEMLPKEKKATKVFIPRFLAKQVYMLWLESVFNNMEEQRQQTLRDDEQFARLLKHPKYAECTESPENVSELLDMELAWSICNSDQQTSQQAAQQTPNDIATHLTKMKLCEKFPEVPNETVLEIFAGTGNNYGKTIEVLDSNAHSSISRDELFEQARLESEKLNEQQKKPPDGSSNGRSGGTPQRTIKSPQLQEDAKNAALRDFEETRNLAAHHVQLKAECLLKARQEAQRGNGGVALYYSEISNLHRAKIDIYNQRAANCIMEVHKYTQNNPDLLDLHYLHTQEAISCLDLFLDEHITTLRTTARPYKHVFIITGRGLHSTNGVSTIKNRVRARLGERRLRWTEVNPGLLKVKLFSASRHAKNF